MTFSDLDVNKSDEPAYVERTWTATDECGNTSSCMQIIDIEGHCVGGEAYPISKIGLVAPWLALVIVIAGGGVYLVRRRVHS